VIKKSFPIIIPINVTILTQNVNKILKAKTFAASSSDSGNVMADSYITHETIPIIVTREIYRVLIPKASGP
jgi:hypothetical protein